MSRDPADLTAPSLPATLPPNIIAERRRRILAAYAR